MHDLLIIRLVNPRLLATWIALDGRDFMVWLVLSGVPRVVPLAFVKVVVVISLLVMVALGKAVIFLIFLVSPPCCHVTQLHGRSWAIAPEVVVRVLREMAVLEATNDVLIGDVGDGGACLEETPCVGLRVSFISCFTWARLWQVPALIMDPWKLLTKARLRSSHELMEFVMRLSSHVKGADSRATGK
jgi:hypothetical protein